LNTVSLIFGCHAHQPVGNFDFVFRRAYDDCYRPFLDVLERHPGVKVVLHFTGPLFDWFEEHQPDFLDRVAGLVAAGRVEIMGGGYYEPLLCAIPERDAVSQILRMRTYCAQRFGVEPRGMWLTERVWEPHMARILHHAGVEYTALDDTHFLCSGLRPDQLFGYYITEDEGAPLKIFPILEKLRYLIPFRQVEETIAYLRQVAEQHGPCVATLHDDYEKFGVWPGTHGSVYGEGWLDRFFAALEENRDWLRTVTYAEYAEQAPPIGRAYIPCASYEEMMTWALPTDAQRAFNRFRDRLRQQPDLYEQGQIFLRGSFWRNFLAKYPEANTMQKRMLRVSARLDRLRETAAQNALLLDKAEVLLHQGQCNCAYWHGVFGGLYLNHLRSAVYERLIAADCLLDVAEGLTGPRWVQTDCDGDGLEEVVLETPHAVAFLKPSDGASLYEWDCKIRPFNLCNVLSRREEPYHDLLRLGLARADQANEGNLSIHEMVRAKSSDLDHYLIYDPWRRACLRDRFFTPPDDADVFRRCAENERGDFVSGPYGVRVEDNACVLEKTGRVILSDHSPRSVRVEKRIEPAENGLRTRYTLSCPEGWPEDLCFGVELAFNFLTGSAPDRYYHSDSVSLDRPMLGHCGIFEHLVHLALRDEWMQLECGVRVNRPSRFLHFPIDTVSQSEDGQERVHQGCVVLPCWTLPAGDRGFDVEMTLYFQMV